MDKSIGRLFQIILIIFPIIFILVTQSSFITPQSMPKLKITSTSPTKISVGEVFNEYEGQAALAVYGEGFSEKCKIFVNGKALATTYGNEGFITVIVPENLYEKSGELIVEVKFLNDKGEIMLSSNSSKITIR